MKRSVMHHSYRVIVSLLLTMLLVAGCGQFGSDASAQQEMEPPSRDEIVTLSVYGATGVEVPSSAGLQDDPVMRYIEDAVGVTVNVVKTDSDSLRVMVASGGLYDIVVMGRLQYVEPLIRASSILNMDDYLEYAPVLTGEFESMLQYSREYLSAGTGGLYAIPRRAKAEATPTYPSQHGNFIRWDYYTEIGRPPINSLDDLVDVVARIVELHPTTEAGKPVYGFLSYSNRKYAAVGSIGPFDSYSYYTLDYYDLYNDKNAFWQDTLFEYKGRRRGLLLPEANSEDEQTQLILNGQIVRLRAEYQAQEPNRILRVQTDGAAQYVDIPFEDNENWPAVYDRVSTLGYPMAYVISSKCAHPEKAMQLINLLYSEEGARTILCGVEGNTWEWEGTAPTMRTTLLEFMAADHTLTARYGMRKYLGMIGRDFDALDSNGYPLDLMLLPEVIRQNMTRADYEYADYYGAETPLDVIGNRRYRSTENTGYSMFFPIDIPADIAQKSKTVWAYLAEQRPILLEAGTESEYDEKLGEIRGDLKALGYDDVRNYYMAAFQDAIIQYERYT